MRAQELPVFSWTSFLRVSLVALGALGLTGANGDTCTIRIVIDSETHDHDDDHDEDPGEGEGEGEPVLVDRDGDGLNDDLERALGTDPYNPDTDFDGLLDGDEACVELAAGAAREDAFAPSSRRCAGTDPTNADTDFDGLLDGDELYVAGTDPLNPDSDFDGIPDGQDDNRVFGDSDGDGLADDLERAIGTDPFNADSDFDGLLDGQESCAQPPPTPCPDVERPVALPACDPGFVAVPVDECGYEWACVQDATACPDIYIEPPTCADGEVAIARDACGLAWECVAADGSVAGSDGSSPQDPQQDPQRNDGDDVDPQDAPVAAPPPWSCTDPLNADSDFDGLTDAEELYRTGTDPLNPDTDGDGITDGADR